MIQDDSLFNLGGTQVISKLDLASPMMPSSININSELGKLSSTQNFTKSVSQIGNHPVVNNGGFYTKNSSIAYQKQQSIMAENRTSVYSSAL